MLKGLMKYLNKPIVIAVFFSIIAGMLVYYFSALDIWVTSLFYDPEFKGVEGFYLRPHPFLMAMHNAVMWVVLAMVCLYATLILGNIIRKRPVLFGLTNLALCYLLLTLIIGPGLVVNVIFKDHFGRARPVQVEAFGGTKTFTPPFVISDQCERNCSFVSGDPSVGFVLFSFVMLYGARWVWLPLLTGGTMGMVRIMQGAHFFSDVLFSGIFTFWVCYGLYYLLAYVVGNKRFIQ